MSDAIRRRSALGVVAAILVLTGARHTPAQAIYGALSGRARDATGGALSRAEVTLTNRENGTTIVVTTGEAGEWSRERLSPGSYRVRVVATGFRAAEVPNVRVGVDTRPTVDLVLELGPRTETVTVETTPGQLLQSGRADVATTFEDRDVTDLPLDHNLARLLLLVPGANQQLWQHASSENPQRSAQVMVGGQHFGGTAFSLDGTDNRDPLLGLVVINPNAEAVAEVKIATNTVDAESGQALAAVVSVRTRSGTDQLRGVAFEHFTTDALQARNPFTQAQRDPLTGRFIPETERHLFGGALGGPLPTRGWFWFADYQGTRDRVGGTRLLTVPTARARSGDLGEYGVAVFDPQTGDPGARTMFPGSVIPAQRLSPQARRLLERVPMPNRAGIIDNYLASGSEDFQADAFDVRVDGRIGGGDVFARYSAAWFDRDGPTALGEAGGAELVSLGGTSRVRNQSLSVGLVRPLGSAAVADVRLGFYRYEVDVLPFDYGTTPAADAGIPGLNLDAFSSGLPAVHIEGPYGFGFGSSLGINRCNCPLAEDERLFQLASNFTRAVGRHTLKAGLDVRRAWNLRVPSDAHRSGELFFTPERTRGPDGGGLGLASFLLGDVSRFGRFVSSTTDAEERQWRHSYYLQDTWQPMERLTVTAGLRLDVVDPQTVNRPGNGAWLDLRTGELRVAGVGGIGLDGDVANALNWAPRLGAIWKIDERTVARAGFGRSHDVGVFGSNFGFTVTQNLPVLIMQDVQPARSWDAAFDLGAGPPSPPRPAVPADGRLPLPDQVGARALPDRQRLPRVDAWNVSMQRQLGEVTTVALAYVGSRGRRVFAGDGPAIDVNEPVLLGFPQVPRDERRPLFGRFGWSQPVEYACNCARNRADALQASVRRRLSGGVSLLAHYTLQSVVQEGYEQFIHDRRLSRGRPDWARRHNVVAAMTADLPFGRDRSVLTRVPRWLDAVVGGWQLNLIGVVQSGTPFEVTYRDAGADRDVGPNRPDRIGDPMVGGGTREAWFNATPIGRPGSAFARPAPGTFGNLARNALTGPGYWRVDLSAFKTVPIRRRVQLQLRVEAVNAFNHVNLGNPDAEVGVPGNDNPDAGRITSTAYYGSDPPRTVQVGMRLAF